MNKILGNRALDTAYSYDFDFESTNEYELSKIKELLPRVINDRLTERQKQCVKLYYFDNFTMKEIGLQLGIDRTTVSRTLKRARERIKKSLNYYIQS